MLITSARLVLEREIVAGWLRTDGASIAQIGSGAPAALSGERVFDCAGRTVAPGFFDLHVHGGGGADFLDADPAAVAAARAYHRARGTTRSLASLVAAPIDRLCTALERLVPSVESGLIAGVHLEGPFLAPAHRGAQDPRYLIDPDPGALAELLHAGRGTVRMVTIAPELPEALELIPLIRAAGAVAAIGHTGAPFEVARAAIDAGASVATHLWNGMRAVHHRDPGAVVACLSHGGVACELIADGVHLHPATVRFAAEILGDRFVFVSDATAAAGTLEGSARLGSVEFEVRDAVARIAGSGTIAGSTATLAGIVRHAVTTAGIPLIEALSAASTRPARLAGLGGEFGAIAPGHRADLVVLEDSLQVHAVMTDGQFVPTTPG